MNYGWEMSSLHGFSPTNSSVNSPGSLKKKRITRVRTGCQTCRNRRVKCGEERPECHNCLRTNHVCPGYPEKKLVPSRTRDGVIIGSELVRRNRDDRLPARMESTLSWSSTPVDGYFDLRLLQHYIQFSAPTLSLQGIIGRAWAQDVPQLAFGGSQEHLIHSLLAVSAAHINSKNPMDVNALAQAQLHYHKSLALLGNIKFDEGVHAPATLAAIMLLTWYEALRNSRDNEVVHLQGARNLVRRYHQDLIRTPVGRRLFHIFSRLELSVTRTQGMEPRGSYTEVDVAVRDNAIEPEWLTLSDSLDGTTEFEMAWMELMRITSLVKKIRDIAHLEFTRVGDFGFPERHEEGEAIQIKLLEWELSLPASFTPVEPPVPLELLDMPILKLVQPIFYANTNIAIAMAHYEASKISVFNGTHRADCPIPQFVWDAVYKTVRICIGMLCLRKLGLYSVTHAGDFGILWPLIIAFARVPRGDLRSVFFEIIGDWPQELILHPDECKKLMELRWSRQDLGVGPEVFVIVKDQDGIGLKAVFLERGLEGEYAGWLRRVDMKMKGEEKYIFERAWQPPSTPRESLYDDRVELARDLKKLIEQSFPQIETYQADNFHGYPRIEMSEEDAGLSGAG